jgi:hypothetical protein
MYPLTFVSERAPTSSGAPTGESSLADRYQLERHAIRVKPFAEGGRTTWEFVASLIVLSIGFVVSFLLIQRRTPRRVDVLVASAADRRAKRRAETPEERLRLQRAVAWVLLLFQRELYVVLRYFALFGAFSSLALLIFRPRAHGVPIDSWWFLLSIPLMLITVIVGQRAIVQSGRVVRLGFGPGKRYLLRVSSSTWRDQILWIIELASRLVLLLFGVGYFVVSMTWLVEVLNFDPPLSAVFFERATAIGSGLSPALPLILSGLGFAMWASWHLTRISLLSEPTVYEDYLLQEDFEDSGRRQLLQNAKTSAREAERYSREAVRIALRAVTTHARAGGNGGNGNGNGAKEQPQIFRRAAAAMDLAERNVKKAEKAAFDADSRTPLDAPKRERETHADELRERHRLVADAWRATSAAKRTLDEVKREFSASSERQTLAVAERDEELSSIGLGDGQERARETAEYKSIIDEEDQARPNFVRALRRAHERFHAWIDRLHDSEDPSPHASNAARAIHEGLFYLVPGVPAIFFLVLLGLTAVWLLLQFESSFESAVLIRRTAFFGLSAFDWLFRFGLLATLGAIAWAVYRFLLIWRGLRRLLATLDPSFKSAFSGLPEEFKRLTRLTPFGAPSRASVEEAVTTHWREMRRIYASNEAAFIDTPAVAISGSTNVAMGPPRMRARPYELNPYLSDEFGFFARSVERFKRVDIPDTANAAIKRGISPYQPDTMEMFRTARVNWADSSTSLLAVYVADYVEWVFQHLRYLAVFLLVSLVLTMVFLSVYPFQPQGVIKAVFFVEAGVAIASIIAILFQMNRDATLSAITRGNANVIDWNRQFVGSLLTYGAVPVLTFISTEFPVVRDFLFSWVSPLLRAFGRS